MRTHRSTRLLRLVWAVAVSLAFVLLAPSLGARLAEAAGDQVAARFPMPLATEAVPVSGVVVALAEGQIAVLETGSAAPVAFHVAPGTTFSRAGYNAVLEELRPGDAIAMTVDGNTGTVLSARVRPAEGFGAPSGSAALLAAIGLLGAAGLLAYRTRREATLAAIGQARVFLLGSRRPAVAVGSRARH